MDDVEKIIAEGFAGVLVVRREMSEAQRAVIARVALESLRAAGYEVEKPEWQYSYKSKETGSRWGSGSLLDARLGAEAIPSVVERRRKAGVWQEVIEGEA